MDFLDGLGAAAQANLLTPAILFFALGIAAGWAKSDLSIPEQVAKALALYLMLCIGFKGGVEARASGLSSDLLATGAWHELRGAVCRLRRAARGFSSRQGDRGGHRRPLWQRLGGDLCGGV
jgi:hypothetical protein